MFWPSLIMDLNKSVRPAEAYCLGVTQMPSLKIRCRWEGLLPTAFPSSARVGLEFGLSDWSGRSQMYWQTLRTRRVLRGSWSGRQRLQALKPAFSASYGAVKKETRWGDGRRLGQVGRQ